MCIIVLFTAFVMKTFEVCVLKSFDEFGSFAADGLTVKLACRHTRAPEDETIISSAFLSSSRV